MPPVRESKASLPADDATLASRLSNLGISQVEFRVPILPARLVLMVDL
jgi:hypothetical protein